MRPLRKVRPRRRRRHSRADTDEHVTDRVPDPQKAIPPLIPETHILLVQPKKVFQEVWARRAEVAQKSLEPIRRHRDHADDGVYVLPARLAPRRVKIGPRRFAHSNLKRFAQTKIFRIILFELRT